MTDFKRINAPRVNKIMQMIAVIDKSAISQRASEEDIAALLQPIANRMTDATYGDTPVEDEPTPRVAPQQTPKHPARSPQTILEGLTPEEMLAVAYVALMKIDEDVYDNSLKQG